MQDARQEDPFAHTPLRDANRLATGDKDLARTAPRETDDAMRGLADERSLVNTHLATDRGDQNVVPPVSGRDRAASHVARPAQVSARDPPVDPKVVGLQEHETSSTLPSAQGHRTDPVGVQDVARLIAPEHQGRLREADDEHRRRDLTTKHVVVVEVFNAVRHEARGKNGAQRGCGSGTCRQRHQGPSGIRGWK